MMQLQIHQQMCQPTRRCVRKTCTVGVIPAGCLQHSRHVRCRAAGQEASAAASGAGAGNTPAAAAVAAAQAGSTKKPSANQQCCDILANISITIIGDDTELNWEVCKALSKRIGWFPTSTAKVLQGLHKVSSVAELEQKLGAEGLVKAEAEVLKGLSKQFRICVATLGNGASSQSSTYPSLYGSCIVWLDEEDPRKPKPDSPTRQLQQQEAEVRAKLQVSGGFTKPVPVADKAKQAAGQLVRSITQLIKLHDYLPAKKRLYVEYGCRGDWPELQPKEWNPVLDLLDRRPVGDAAAAAATADGRTTVGGTAAAAVATGSE